jgi:hypothetical protein
LSYKLHGLQGRFRLEARYAAQTLVGGGAFEPKAAAILVEAFNAVVAELDLRTNAEKERAAKIVIRLAHGQQTFGAAKIRDQAIIAVRKESIPRRRRPF